MPPRGRPSGTRPASGEGCNPDSSERMMKLTAAFLFLGTLSGCAVSPPDNSANFKPGIGVVEAVKPARVAVPQTKDGAIAGSEAAGGRYGTAVERIFRPRW